ncbi:MAG: hypothetical protein FJ077_07700 [Cyanobacteria bacterium K_DeepCast_35m_m2_023]|nr:hypothetical protein [Cyanobacteria bacterium K_DeepCast_35m_m2_023]
MSDQQVEASNPWIPRLLLWAPATAGGLLALMVLAVGSFPLLSQLQLQGREVEEKRAQEQQLPRLRADLVQVARQQQTAERQQQQLVRLIAGSGELTTFMAQVDREARRHGVQLQLYEPTAALPGAEAEQVDALKGQKKGTKKQRDKQAAAKQGAQTAEQRDPLQQAGLASTKLLLSAKGRYPNLLAFMRAMESLNLLVVQTNLTLNQSLANQANNGSVEADQQKQSIMPIALKLAIALYRAKS